MNVFVLCTGRCGSHTFAKAGSHITNFTCEHESRKGLLGSERVAFPGRHIEVDNRLSWFLGRLESRYGDSAYYVHLKRDPEEVARSYNQRWNKPKGIISAYRTGIVVSHEELDPMAVSRDLVATMNENIEAFVATKTHRMTFRLENAREDWGQFWEWIGAEGSFGDLLEEWEVRHKATKVKNRGLLSFLGRRVPTTG